MSAAVIMMTLLMVQFQSFGRMFTVIAIAPLGLIGVVPSLSTFHAPMVFAAFLGFQALFGSRCGRRLPH